jgi:hypothetical protein
MKVLKPQLFLSCMENLTIGFQHQQSVQQGLEEELIKNILISLMYE